jgi:hypothetical protein
MTHSGFEVLGAVRLIPRCKALSLFFECTFLLFGSVIRLTACARYFKPFSPLHVHFQLKRQKLSLLDRRAMTCYVFFPYANSVSQMLTTFSNIYLINDHLDMHTWI